MTQTVVSDRTARFVLAVDRFALGLARHWLLFVNVIFGGLVLAPFAAPVLMAIGATQAANAIYFFYGLLCHQLPQRSFFLLGPKISYSLAEIGSVWQYDGILTLREFIGNSAMGWKVAWSDRMVAMYGALWIGGILFALFRRRRLHLSPVTWLLLGILPMLLDGLSHTVNDIVAGISGIGFRDTNAWLQFLTGNIFPATFYAGDALGSFNNLARLVTGALFGLTTIWFIYPFVDQAMQDVERQTRMRLAPPRAARWVFHPRTTRFNANEIDWRRFADENIDEIERTMMSRLKVPSGNFILTILLGTVLFLGVYLIWTTWINPRPTISADDPWTQPRAGAPAAGKTTPSANITIVPASLTKEGVPSKLGSLALTKTMTGQDALAEFAQLHGKGFDLTNGYMAHYGKDEALLWVGQAKNDEVATDMLAQMAEKIGPDNAMFKDLNSLDISGRTLYSAVGQGQQHFFYAVNDKIVWLAANADQAADALHSLWSAVK